MKFLSAALFFLFLCVSASRQGSAQNIFVPEGLNLPGTWDAFTNPPNKAVYRMANPPGTSIEVPCGTDVVGGTINLFNNLYPSGQLATSMYRASFAAADAGGAGNYNFLLTSGPCSNFFQNKWSRSNIAFTGVGVTLNTVQTYYHCNTAGAGSPAGCVDWGNTDITLSAGKYYTLNFADIGYANTTAVFFETSAPPVTISSVAASYDNTVSACNGGGGVVVTVTCSGAPSVEERVYVRYASASTFATSVFAPVVFADTTQLNVGKAIIPFSAGTTYFYYALTSTMNPAAIAAYSAGSQTDIVTLMSHTNSGAIYSYAFTTTSAGSALSGYYLIDNTAGTYFPNSFAFSSLANAVTAINTNGICGHTVIQVKGNYTETTPAGGLVIQYAAGAPVSSALKTLSFRKMGSAGSHPLITAWNNSAGTTTAGSAAAGDGIFKIIGGDYILVEHIDLKENNLNTAAGPRMEYGFALLKESATNGSQYCTITGCNIQLSRLNNTAPTGGNEAGSTGIASLSISNTSSASLTITSVTGSNSNNRFTANSISNVFNGIVVKGFNAGSPYSLYDQKNVIGKNGSGNVIQNYGGSGSVAAYGIYLIYQNLDSVQYNTIDNLAGGGVVHTDILYGIFCSTTTNGSAYVGGNTISVAKGNANNDLVAFRTSLTGSGKTDFVNNTITNCSSSGGSGS
ncbi:MAG TPA: hypothetical protein PLD84_12875, partial [Chitinophagales bacterium]|nr:hypothetical protein [Chitinophagales bacterium]